MPFRVTALAEPLRDQPDANAPASQGEVAAGDLVEKLTSSAPPEWMKLRVVNPGEPLREGFVPSTLALQAVEPAAPPVAIDKAVFYDQLAFAAQRFGSNRDYLYAVAFAETKVRNVKAANSSAFGPFQFIPSTWKGLLNQHPGLGLAEADIVRPDAQTILAAIATASAQAALTQALGRVPMGVELYLAHFLGLPAAQATLKADPQRPIDVPLRAFYAGTTKGAGFVDQILLKNQSLLRDGGSVRTTEAVLGEMEKRLQPGYTEAETLAQRLGFVVPPPTSPDLPPWMATARAELAKPVIENKAPGASNPDIDKYFAGLLNNASDDTAWCAAFVSWCMANCGVPAVAQASRRSVRAADWLTWGKPAGQPVVGAVAVTVPLAAGASGHVGFVTGISAGKIKLLAGNQRNSAGQEAVCEVDFALTKVREFRTL
jgi:uncharacterized protein (TIGR02594 family)